MAIWGDFQDVLDELITSERQAEFAPIVVEKLYDRLRRDDYGIVIDGVRNGDLSASLVVNDTYNAIPFVAGDSCDIGDCEISPEYTAKQWEIVMAECRYTLCTREASRKFMALWGQYKAIRPDDSEYDFVVEQMSDILSDILVNSLIAKLFLSDKAYTEDTINGINGFISQWKLEADNVLDVSAMVADTEAITGEEWYNVMIAMMEAYEADSTIRRSRKEAQFIIDETGARKIINMLNGADRNSIYDCACLDAEGMVRAGRYSIEGLQVAGIPVRTIPYSDMIAQFDELNTLGVPVDPLFAVLTPKTEVQIGTPAMDELEMEDSFYDRKDRTYYFDIGYQFGAMIPSRNFILADATEE